jgi:hypothetical protein
MLFIYSVVFIILSIMKFKKYQWSWDASLIYFIFSAQYSRTNFFVASGSGM